MILFINKANFSSSKKTPRPEEIQNPPLNLLPVTPNTALMADFANCMGFEKYHWMKPLDSPYTVIYFNFSGSVPLESAYMNFFLFVSLIKKINYATAVLISFILVG